MDYFAFSKHLLFRLPPEMAHDVAIKALACGTVPRQPVIRDEVLKMQVAGLQFNNPVGLAAGFDKNAVTLGHMFGQGFGFVECGTVTPWPQEGNPRPRIFRIPQQRAVVNRLGFNNAGIEAFTEKLKAYKGRSIVGANIGKNKDSADAVSDYLTCMRAVYPHASYITVNISSPNTAGLRDLQAKDSLEELVKALHGLRQVLVAEGLPVKPIFVKIAPDLSPPQREAIAQVALAHALDGLIISNTTITRPGLANLSADLQQGGLSGKPLFDGSTELLREMYRLTGRRIPLIGVGGISSAQDAYAKIQAGASLVQVYTGLIYQGFGLVTAINRGLLSLLRRDGITKLRDAVGVGVE